MHFTMLQQHLMIVHNYPIRSSKRVYGTNVTFNIRNTSLFANKI